MRFAALGSGSRGNAWLIESAGTRVLVDCGFSRSETCRRLARLGCAPEGIDALVITHEHGDHVRGAGPLARQLGVPVWMSHGTHQALGEIRLDRLQFYAGDAPFAVGGLELQPFPVPHDAREPCQFVVGDGARRLGLVTDLGSLTEHVVRSLADLDALVLEANHDLDLLLGGGYPARLKARVASPHGHLSNALAAELLGRLDRSRLQHVVAAHLSDANNSRELATAAFAGVLGCRPGEVTVASQEEGLDWRQVV